MSSGKNPVPRQENIIVKVKIFVGLRSPEDFIIFETRSALQHWRVKKNKKRAVTE